MAGGGVDLPEGGPQPQRPIADSEQRRRQAALPQVAQDAGPGLRALAVAQAHRQELLGAIVAGPDDDEQAGVLVLEPRAEIDPVGPDVGKPAVDRAVPPGAVVGLPRRFEVQDRRGAQGGLGTQEPPEGGLEVARAQALEVQPGAPALRSPG